MIFTEDQGVSSRLRVGGAYFFFCGKWPFILWNPTDIADFEVVTQMRDSADVRTDTVWHQSPVGRHSHLRSNHSQCGTMEGSGETYMEFKHKGRLLIKSFFERITAEQMKMLRAGFPDDDSQMLLSELILDTIRSVTNSVLTALRNIYEPDSGLKFPPSLEEVLSQISLQAQCFQDQVELVSSESLPVSLAGDSDLSAGFQTSDSVVDEYRMTSPQKITAMVRHAAKVLKEKEDARVAQDPAALFRSWQLRKTQNSPEGTLSKDFKARISQTLQMEISKTLINILTPLLDDMSNGEYDNLQTDITDKLQDLSTEIDQLIRFNVPK